MTYALLFESVTGATGATGNINSLPGSHYRVTETDRNWFTGYINKSTSLNRSVSFGKRENHGMPALIHGIFGRSRALWAEIWPKNVLAQFLTWEPCCSQAAN